MSYVLTLGLDDDSHAHFERLRRMYFPPERNLIPAHLTLFHLLPEVEPVRERVAAEAGEWSRFAVRVTGVRALGRGVAYRMEAEELSLLHARLSAGFADVLSPQDRQRFQPHIVVQNKVKPEAARLLLGRLESEFVPMEPRAVGLDLWEYMGGPWRMERRYAFRAE